MKKPISFSEILRHLFFSWLLACLLEYLLLPTDQRALEQLACVAQMSFPRLLLLTLGLSVCLTAAARFVSFEKIERWGMVAAFLLLAGLALTVSFQWALLIFCLLIGVILVVYAITGHDSTVAAPVPQKAHKGFVIGICILTGGFCLCCGVWTVFRYLSFSTPTFDFGLFAQMFHSMRTTGLPMTTLERDTLLSHFAVHVSPIYYLMLPFYWLFPDPVTLQILQVLVIASAVIPLWLIGKAHGLSGFCRFLLCSLLLLLPVTSGGIYYDLHENCFLLPLILWLMYALDRRSIFLTVLFALLTLCVKEDAAVYVAVAGLYTIIHAAVTPSPTRRKDLLLGAGVFLGAVCWFLMVTAYLTNHGNGVMTYRYNNMMYDRQGGLISVVIAVLMCPMKMLFECVDADKLPYIYQTLLPLLCLPLITRKYQRYLLLIPYILVNLIADYTYQHDILFQYNFGSTAFLIYLTALNLADLRPKLARVLPLCVALAVSLSFLSPLVLPKVKYYIRYYTTNIEYFDQLGDTLDQIPADASVTAPTFYTAYLSQRDTIYDIRHCSQEHLLSSDYVIVKLTPNNSDNKKYEVNGANGTENLIALLESNGYTVYTTFGSVFSIYQKN